jgi:hypothetical protein
MLRQTRSARLLLSTLAACLGAAAAQNQNLAHHYPHGPVLENPVGFHVFLRKPIDKLIYNLGERIELEAACTSDTAGQYSSECHAELDILPVDAGAMLTVDPIDTQWIEPILCPGGIIGNCGSFFFPPDAPLASTANWITVWPKKHLPVTPGRFSARASVLGFDRTTDQTIKSMSPSIEVEVVGNQLWSAQVFERAVNASRPNGYDLVSLFPDVETMRWLLSGQKFRAYGYPAAENDKIRMIEMYPDRAAMAALLTDQLQNEPDGDSIGEEINEILAMRLAAEEPELYDQVTSNFTLSADQTEQVRRWLLPRRRALLLLAGKSLTQNFASQKLLDPEDPDMDELESKAETLVGLSITRCPGETEGVLTARELKQFMQRARLSPRFIANQLTRFQEKKQ